MVSYLDPVVQLFARVSPQNNTFLVLDVVVLVVALVAAIGLYQRRSRNPMGLPYPPGPKKSIIPLVGNIPDMPESEGSYLP
jgi:hypothetical protein